MGQIDISIIVPVYNASEFLGEFLDGIANQSFTGALECFFIDDKSTDNSVEILRGQIDRFKSLGIEMTVLSDGTNRKQGARRNEGVQLARGKYIMFLDSDDYIHSKTLETCFLTAESEADTDMVHFNYAYYNADVAREKQITPQVPNFLYDSGLTLIGEECEKMLSLDPFFTVNRFYKREFLEKHNLHYGEGYFYEDIEFFVGTIVKANKVKLLPNVFYFVRTHDASTTKTAFDSTVHVDSFLTAIETTMADFSPRDEFSAYNVTKYLLNRALLYTKQRMPNNKQLRKEYLSKILAVLPNDDEITLPTYFASNLYYACFALGYYTRRDVDTLIKIYDVYKAKPTKLHLAVTSAKMADTRLFNRFYKSLFKPARIFKLEAFRLKFSAGKDLVPAEEVLPPLNLSAEPTVLMLGFDYRYSGNSKYLFDYLVGEYSSETLKFVTEDEAVPAAYRLEPRSDEAEAFLLGAHVVIAESWVPLDYVLQEPQKLIQLWHGTPLKKLLYDSPEGEVIRFNPTHKTRKKWDINRWDTLISDSPLATEKFKTAFAIEGENILETGYPRANWLVDHQDDEALKKELRASLNIPEGKKVILYVPTWREYNFKQRTSNNLYKLDWQRFEEHLSPEFDYVVLEKSHSMSLAKERHHDKLIQLPNEEDIQPYLLIADIVISDYSSIIFDCLYLGTPFYLLFKDYDYYKEVRGVYEDLMVRFDKGIAYSEKELAEIIVNYDSFYEGLDYADMISTHVADSNQRINEKIKSYFSE